MNWHLARRRTALQARAYILQLIRTFFSNGGYLEVDTPLLIPAPAPELHIDAILCGELFLHTSPELCMKRMLAAGYEKIFQICHCWRQAERGTRHLPEFTMLEWYCSHTDYSGLMAECEQLLPFILTNLRTTATLEFQGTTIDLTPPWERITVADAFRRYTDCCMEEALRQGNFDELMVERIEPNLGIEKPTFIMDYPASRAALAQLKPGNPLFAERFELYIAGMELANAFTELIDPEEQRTRFRAEREERSSLGKSLYPLPTPFLDEMVNMPPCAGIALGIDRLVMLLTDSEQIDDVVAFTPEEL